MKALAERRPPHDGLQTAASRVDPRRAPSLLTKGEPVALGISLGPSQLHIVQVGPQGIVPETGQVMTTPLLYESILSFVAEGSEKVLRGQRPNAIGILTP